MGRLRSLCVGGGWLDQVGIRLTQLSTGLKVEAELGKKTDIQTIFLDSLYASI